MEQQAFILESLRVLTQVLGFGATAYIAWTAKKSLDKTAESIQLSKDLEQRNQRQLLLAQERENDLRTLDVVLREIERIIAFRMARADSPDLARAANPKEIESILVGVSDEVEQNRRIKQYYILAAQYARHEARVLRWKLLGSSNSSELVGFAKDLVHFHEELSASLVGISLFTGADRRIFHYSNLADIFEKAEKEKFSQKSFEIQLADLEYKKHKVDDVAK
ncbi:MAG: hypothetical protein ACOYON_15860 [Fimbriimonas sp.]